MISNIDTLILDNGELLISANKVQLHLKNGEILSLPDNSNSNAQIKKEAFEIEYVIVPNWSLNFYNGYPIPGLQGNLSAIMINISNVWIICGQSLWNIHWRFLYECNCRVGLL